jgi:hypothetical protein
MMTIQEPLSAHDAKVKLPLHAAAPRLWLLDSLGASTKAASHRKLYKFWVHYRYG